MLKSSGWPLRRVVEEFKTKEGKWKERLDCGHIIERHPTFMKHYRPQRRRCKECALEKGKTG